jgi:RNA polymerase sigma-70 factor (ECF subfamily)
MAGGVFTGMAQDQAEVAIPVMGAVDANEQQLVAALRRREEAAFAALVKRYHSLMLRVAYAQLNDVAAGEDVVQETWLAVIRGIDSFQGRSSLRTWMFRILTHQASARLERDGRQIPFSALVSADAAAAAPSVEPSRFLPRKHESRPYFWVSDPREWPEDALLAAEVRSVIAEAVRQLPASQRVVITLRDLDGWAPDEVCEALEISDGNQRVLLHRARARLRAVLDDYLGNGER